jgi:putative acetyltransferase
MSRRVEIVREAETDRAAVRAIQEAAFGARAEADLVDALRRDGDLVLSLVARADGGPVGHVAFSRLAMPETGARGVALAPLAVKPSFQRQGIGAALVREALATLASAGEDVVLVLGDPAYYGRFGFAAAAAQALRTPYDGPYLQALALSDAGRAARGRVRYAAAFAELA